MVGSIEMFDDVGLEYEDDGDRISDPFDPQKIRISKKIISLDQIIRRIKNNTIQLSPDFQRNEVWNATKKSQLIESLMLNIPIPLFYVYANENGNWDVIDGLQRLSAIRDFIIEKKLVLQNMEFLSSYDGKGFDDFSPILYNRIYETEFSFIIVEPETPIAVRYNIFKRINTGGVPLSPQEIRHAIFNGKATEFLKELSSTNEFISACDGSINDKRMGAREIILRCLIFMVLGTDGYLNNDTMESFLNRGIQILNYLENLEPFLSKNPDISKVLPKLKNDSYNKLKEVFIVSMVRNQKLFDRNAFRISLSSEKRTPVNKALFDVWGVIMSELNENEFDKLLRNKKDLNKKYDMLKKNSSFYDSVSRNAWQKTNVDKRYYYIYDLIEEFIK